MKWEIEEIQVTEQGLDVTFVRGSGIATKLERIRGIFTKWVTIQPEAPSLGDHGASGVRDYVANSVQILEAVLAELHEREGAPFIPGIQDDLLGIRMRLRRALDLLDAR